MKEGEASGGIHQTANDMSDMEKEKESGGEEEKKCDNFSRINVNFQILAEEN